MSDVDVKELKSEIAKILSKADLAKTSTKTVIKELEKNMGVDLKNKKNKKLIDKLVMKYVNGNQSGSEDDDDDEEEEEDDEEEEEKEKAKEKKPTKRAAPASKAKAKRKRSSSEYDETDDSKDSDYEMERNDPPATETKGKKKDSGEGKGKKGGGGRGKGGGYTRAYKLSPALGELMGAEEMPKHEVVKRVWALVKEKNLYDPNNKQFTICDEALYKVFGIKRFRTFGMMKYLKSHFLDE